MEDEIERAEKILSSMSISDANLRLTITMTRLTDNVSLLSKTVATLTGTVQTLVQDINGGSGVRTEIKDLKRDLGDSNRKIDELADKIKVAQKILWRLVWGFGVVGVVTVISDIRSFAPLLMEGLK